MHKKEHVQRLQTLQREIKSLRKDLNALNVEKEKYFSQRTELQNSLKSKIHNVNELRKQRNNHTAKVKELKQKRNQASSQLRESIAHIKKVKRSPEKKGMSPERLKEQIENLEFRIETEGLPFDKEQQLTKKIKEMKKSLDEALKTSQARTEYKTLSKSIKSTKKEADSHHSLVKEHAKKSQEAHEKVVLLSKEIDALRDTQTDVHNKFVEKKKQYNEVNEKLQAKLDDLTKVKAELDKITAQNTKEKKQKEEKQRKQHEDKLAELIKSGKKLTTEDLMGLK